MEEITRLKRTRAAHRGLVTRLIPRINEALDHFVPNEKKDLLKFKKNLEEKAIILKELDGKILEIVVASSEGEDEILREAEEAATVMDEIDDSIIRIQLKMESNSISPAISVESIATNFSANSRKAISAKPPKLELQQFDGKPQNWSEFWDSFCSAVEDNEDLSDAVKFQYLRKSLLEPARSVVSGFKITGENYRAAIDLLKQRYARPALIKRAHINEMLNAAGVFNERNVTKMKSLHDKVETHLRGLESMGIDQDTFASIVVPVLFEKIPQSVRLNMVRSAEQSHLEWNVTDFLSSLQKELDVRELHEPIFKGNPHSTEEPRVFRRHADRVKEGTATALLSWAEVKRCAFCQEEHHETKCMNVKDINTRKSILKNYGRCFICLRKGHRAMNCRSKVNCSQCKKRHNTALCNFRDESREDDHRPPSLPAAECINIASCVQENKDLSCATAALQTAQALINGDRDIRVRVLFDSGSQKSFITTQAAKMAGLHPIRRERLGIKVFGSDEGKYEERDLVVFDLMNVEGGERVRMSAFIVENISDIPNIHVESIKKGYKHLSKIWFSDVDSKQSRLELDILIGSNFLWNFQGQQTIRGGIDEPVAVNTKLGWVISGPLKGKITENSEDCISTLFCIENDEVYFAGIEKPNSLDKDVGKLWDLDSVGVRPVDTVYTDVIDNITFTGKRYAVGLPWKVGHKQLPSNYSNCFSRLKSQIKKLQNHPDLLNECHKIVKDQEERGIIEKVSELPAAEREYYMPNQIVVREHAETTKVRMVFDASSKEGKRGTSLNDCLHVGPSLTPMLFEILIRFREHNVALVGDIEKAFLNVEIDPTDRDSLRFLWVREDGGELSPIVYRFNRMVFGVNSSPFLLNAVIRYHLDKLKETDPGLAITLSENFFVDDLCAGAKSLAAAKELYVKSKQSMLQAGFKLRKWKSNNEELREHIANNESQEHTLPRVKNSEKVASEPGKNTTTVLGIGWDFISDKLEVNIDKMKIDGTIITKRLLLSSIAKVFDPLGFVSPVTVIGKALFQDLCRVKCDWDDELPFEKCKIWEELVKDSDAVKSVAVPRGIHKPYLNENVKYALHGFGDASTKAYCAVIYLVSETEDGQKHSRLVCSKTRLAPLKGLTIPRLELMSGKILAQLMDTVKIALSNQIEISEVKYWLDSKTALYWIYNAGEWKQFVQQRVNEILRISKKSSWNHCPGKENPADLGSRGVLASKLIRNPLWWEGPCWLTQGEELWPNCSDFGEKNEALEEKKKSIVVLGTIELSRNDLENSIDISRFSSFNRLLRVTAWVLRFVKNIKLKQSENRELREITTSEMQEAEDLWIKQAQMHCRDEKSKPMIASLGVYSDAGILRCKGRLEHTELDYETKYPILLPKMHRLTELIVKDCHHRVKHLKVRATLADVRAKYWIPRGRQLVKQIIHKCMNCKRHDNKPFDSPTTGALPTFRVQVSDPFSKIGVDFAGPLFIKTSAKRIEKAYIALFTCSVTRAVHLELVADMSVNTFLRSFRRFTARRGMPTLVYSDNAKTFKASANLMKQLKVNSEFLGFLQNERIEWKFNLERTPWWGGFYERMVGTVKRCLKKIIGKAKLDHDELNTILIEIEGVLNSRPITYLYEELEAEPLTPSHLMFGRRLTTLPIKRNLENCHVDVNFPKRYRYLVSKLSHFWNRWQHEYLVDLREQHKLGGKKHDIQVGDCVLVQDENVKRQLWKTGLIDSLVKGKDGVVRGVKLRVISGKKSSFLFRPLQKLIPLEVKCEEGQKCERKDNELRPRPKQRAAALDARWRTKFHLDS